LLFFEEIKPTMVEPLKPADTFAEAELANGDLICVQKPPPIDTTLARPLAPAHYAWMLNRYSRPSQLVVVVVVLCLFCW
jgi:ubiquitin carboxyl-terminal hydrolase 7